MLSEHPWSKEVNRTHLKSFVLYIGISFLITHELDAVMNKEWLVLPLTSWLQPDIAYEVFLWAHVPLFALMIALLTSSKNKVKSITSKVLATFLIIHGSLHIAFTSHKHYEFSSLSSNLLIYGGAIFGLIYLMLFRYSSKRN